MKLTCSQMEILMSFYFEGELSSCLKKQAEEHLSECDRCSAKYKMFKTFYTEMKKELCPEHVNESNSEYADTGTFTNAFRTNLSAYVDNELDKDESIKIKKLTITNKHARQSLEDSYNIRRLMNDSFKKAKSDSKRDYTKTILRQLELDDAARKNFHPAISLLIVFTVTVLVLTTLVVLSLSP